MEAKLIKDKHIDNFYYLKIDINTYATTHKESFRVLSHKNCEAIELGYDLMKLAEENSHKYYDVKTTDWHCNYNGFFSGFQKALELLGDKKYSESDMHHALHLMNNQVRLAYIDNALEMVKKSTEQRDKIIKSLQQTEWDVEIVMERYPGLSLCAASPELDADGCIILKRK
jgi:hypothetical protein